jgi:PIN domain nuclease of toxin-antitoxin system
MGLTLQANDVIFLDTSCFIYFFEQHPAFFPSMKQCFDEVAVKDAQIITSIVSFIEIATLPARMGNQELVQQYRDYFTQSKQVTLLPVDLAIAEKAISLRAQYSFKTPDAIQIATAIVHSATYLITNDQQWKQMTDQAVLLVDEV